MSVNQVHNMVWTGTEWVEMQYPSSSDLVTHDGGTVKEWLDSLIGSVATHTGNSGIHVSTTDRAFLTRLAGGEFATIEQLGHALKPRVVNDIAERDALLDLVPGMLAWVKNPVADTNLAGAGTAIYIWNEPLDRWDFVYQFSGEIALEMNWEDVIGRPTSTSTQIDEAVAAIAAVRLGNITTIGTAAPPNPQIGDTWYQPIS